MATTQAEQQVEATVKLAYKNKRAVQEVQTQLTQKVEPIYSKIATVQK